MITGEDVDVVAIEGITRMLMGQFSMMDLSSVTVFMGIQVVSEPTMARIYVFQEKYIASLLERFAMEDRNTAPTPGRSAALERSDADEKMDSRVHRHYKELFSRLLYLSNTTRPDIAYAVLQL